MPATIGQAKCVLVTGATAGIGRALALAIANLPHRPEVIALGRREDRLKELSEAHGLKTVQMDLDTDHLSIKKFSEDLLRRFPGLDAVVLNAGIQHEFDLTKEFDLARLTSELNINYTSIVSLISYLMPHFSTLSAQGRECFFIPVTSGLAILPGAMVPNYSASKAALHSFCDSLRVQLEGSHINVLEIIPPLVESELHDPYGTTEALSETWMTLDDFVKAVIEGLQRGDTTIAVGTIPMMIAKFEQGKLDLAKRIFRSFPKKTGLGVPVVEASNAQVVPT